MMSENENEDMQGKLWACIEYHSWKSYIVNVDTFLFRTKKKNWNKSTWMVSVRYYLDKICRYQGNIKCPFLCQGNLS